MIIIDSNTEQQVTYPGWQRVPGQAWCCRSTPAVVEADIVAEAAEFVAEQRVEPLSSWTMTGSGSGSGFGSGWTTVGRACRVVESLLGGSDDRRRNEVRAKKQGRNG
jgi:hypothetical protein